MGALKICRLVTYVFFLDGLPNDAQDATECDAEDNVCTVRCEEIIVLPHRRS